MLGSWLRLRCAARLIAPLRRSGLTLLIALAAFALLSPPFALTVLALTILALAVLCAPVLPFARREIGRRRLLILANDDFRAVGQVGKAGRHYAIGWREP